MLGRCSSGSGVPVTRAARVDRSRPEMPERRLDEASVPLTATDWEAVALSTEPANRALAESGVVRAYRAAGRPLPRIAWVDSPTALRRVAQEEDGERELAFEHPLFERAPLQIRTVRGLSAQETIAYWIASSWLSGWSDGNERPGLPGYGWFWWGDRFDDHNLGDGGYPTAEWLGRCSLIEADPDLDPLQRALVDIARQTLIWLPLKRIAILCERPELLQVDDAGRLHSTTGAAIRWRDGTGLPEDGDPGHAFIHGYPARQASLNDVSAVMAVSGLSSTRTDDQVESAAVWEYHSESRGVDSLLGSPVPDGRQVEARRPLAVVEQNAVDDRDNR